MFNFKKYNNTKKIIKDDNTMGSVPRIVCGLFCAEIYN